MDIKTLLKTAIDAKIAGDQAGFDTALKQVVSAKVGAMVAEQSGMQAAPQSAEGEYFVNLEEFDYNGELVDAGLQINIGHYQAPTRGTFSATAPDPSTYHGDPEELEWYVVSATLIHEDGSETHLDTEEASRLQFNDRDAERIDSDVLSQMSAKRDDNDDWDTGSFDDDRY